MSDDLYKRGYRARDREEEKDMGNMDPTAMAAGGLVIGAIAFLFIVGVVFKGKVVF